MDEVPIATYIMIPGVEAWNLSAPGFSRWVLDPVTLAKLDFVYLIPALLCNAALLCGLLPAVFCLDGVVFAQVSVAIFLLSLIFHIVILANWRRYRDSSPFAYAVVQPALHLIMLVFALAVGSVSLCVPKINQLPAAQLIESETLPNRDRVSEAVGGG